MTGTSRDSLRVWSQLVRLAVCLALGALFASTEATIHRSSNHTWSTISPLVSVLTTPTKSNKREKKNKRKEKNKKKLQQAVESQTKAKSKITWRRQVSDPLGKGNGSTHPRQNEAQAKSANHQTKARKTTKCSPCTHASSPWTNATPPRRMHAKHHMKIEQLHQLISHRSDRSPPPVRPVPNMCTRPALWPVRPVTSTGQTGAHKSPEMARNHLETF
jgi:hypothetical protein